MIKQSENAVIRRTTQVPIPERVLRQVQQVQATKQSLDRRYTWLVGATVLAFAMLFAMIVESQLNLFSYALRFGLTTVSLAATAFCTWTLWQRGGRENERLVSAAKDVDAAYPVLEERVSALTSCEENRLGARQVAHPAMLNRLSEETSRIYQHVEPKPIVSQSMLKRPLACLAAAGLVMLGLLVWDAPKTTVQFGRFWAPWANLSTTKVTSVEADSVVARHESIKLTATLSGRSVDEVEFHSKSVESAESSTTRIWPSVKDETVAKFRQSKAVESFDYRFRAGDGQTNWHRVTVADRPKIEDLTMRIVPPAYTGKSTRTFRKFPKKLRVISGSRLEVAVKPKAEVRTARLVMGKTDWLSMELSADGVYEGSLELRQPVNFQVQLTEIHGLQNRRPPGCFLQVITDQAPKVKILKPTKTAVLLPDETIDIHFKATDDHGIQKMALRAYIQREGEDDPTVHEVAIPIEADSNNKKIKGSVALDLAQFDLKDGDTIRYEIRASDNFRPLENLDGQQELNPMERVEMVQAEAPKDAITPTSTPQNTVAKPSDNAVTTNSQVAQSMPQANSTPGLNQQASNSPSSNRNGSNEQPTAENPSADNQMAEQSSTKPGLNEGDSAVNDSIVRAKPTIDKVDKTTTDTETPAEELADAANKENPAANENTIQSSRDDDEGPTDAPDTSKIAKSDPSMKQGDQNQNASSSHSSSKSNPSQSASDSQQASSSSSSQSSSSSNSSSKPKMASKGEAKTESDPKADQESTQPKSDPVQMATRSLDESGQSSSSGQQQIKVDQYAGGFTSDHRYKLELEIAPTLELLKESLKVAGKNVRRVMNPTTDDPATGVAAAEEALSRAGESLKIGSEAVIQLSQKTRNTPYAFVGLRLESIRTADVAPAWAEVSKAVNAEGEPRVEHAGNAWSHINRVLATLAKLEEKYEQVKRDLKKADDILKFKKMHRVFIEKSLAMLNPKNFTLNGPDRKGAEFDLDEEYLKRLKEVLQMRQDMMAELARILADDPQLLRRYMNRMNSRTSTIRDQLTLVARDQQALSQRIWLWADASKQPESEFDLIDHTVDATESHLSEIQSLSNQLADLQDMFVSWLPLEDDVEKGDVAETVSSFKAAGRDLTEIVADIEEILLQGGLQPDFGRQVEPLLEKSMDVEKSLTRVSQSLQRIAKNVSDPELANNAVRRLPKMQSIRHDVQQWAGKLELLNDNLVQEVYSVDQENRRDELLRYSVKIASLESQLVAALQNREGQLPAEIADQTKELQKILDVEIPAQQLVASQTLLDDETTLAGQQQKDIVEKFKLAETTFDEILQAIADELDKLPVEDPIASLLRDPTMDEILAQLESEQDFLEELGLSGRSSNLQIIGDWMNGGRGGAGGMSGMLRQLMAQQRRMRNLSNMAYRNALARARTKDKSKKKPKLAKEDRRWNLLVSQLGEDMLQGDNKVPPARYRAAINQYFEQISKLKSGKEPQ